MEDGPTSVYLARSSNDVLLYVGVTGRGAGRMAAHAQGAAWWPFVETLKVEHYPDRKAALKRERELIEAERPRFNVRGNRAICFVCGWQTATVRGRCHACDVYHRRHGDDRPEELIVKHGARTRTRAIDSPDQGMRALLKAIRE